MSFVYIVRCSDHSLYTGYAEDVDKRVAEHNEGTAAKYTRSRLPVHLVYWEEVADRSAALRRELLIKQMTKAQKESLVKSFLRES